MSSADQISEGGLSLAHPSLSLDNDIKLLETKLAALKLNEGCHSSSTTSAFSAAIQNDVRNAFKGIGNFLHVSNSKESNIMADEELNTIQEILKLSLKRSDSNDNDTSGVLSFLKLLVEACPVQNQAEEDIFWKVIIEPICTDILQFLLDNNFKKCLAVLSRTSTGSGSGCGDVTTTETPSHHHGTGFAVHQQIGILLKGIRILLIYLKRATSNLATGTGKIMERESLSRVIEDILQVLCSLMNPLKSGTAGVDFDIGLDIRCNIGVGICYSLFYLRNQDTTHIHEFFRLLFVAPTEESPIPLTKVEKEILSLAESDVNRIALAFGVLNTWLEHRHDADLYYGIAKNVLDIQHGVKEAVNLGSSRVMEIWADKLSRPCVPDTTLNEVVNLFAPLEFFCFMYMPGHIDAVKNCCRNIISALAKIYDRLDEESFSLKKEDAKTPWVTRLLQTVLEKPVHIKWIALACIAKNTKKALQALKLNPQLPSELLTAQRTFKSASNDTYVALMSYDLETGSDSTWDQTWIDPLFTTQLCQNNESNWPQKKSIISIILNSEKLRLPHFQIMILPLLKSVVRRMNSNEAMNFKQLTQNDEDNGTLPEASLLAAEAIKMAYELRITVNPEELNLDSIKDKNTTPDDSFRGLVPRSVLHSWFWNENPQIRLAGFSLLVESKKTSEYISEQDFESLQIFFKYNILSQNPAFRQQFMSYFKKLVRRLKDGESCARRKEDSDTHDQYLEFTDWLWGFLTDGEGLFEGANFGRRCQALECLRELTLNFNLEVVQYGINNSANLKYIRWLTDSYENNKIQALDILVNMSLKEFDNEDFCYALFEEAVTLCTSVKPPDSVTGRYLMTLLMCKSNFSQFSPLNILEALYSELERIYSKIHSTSLIQVSSESPLYGCVRCVRMVFQYTKEFKKGDEILKYQTYVERLLKLCFKIDDTLFPVLGSAAPEGFLPGLQDSAPENKQVVRSLAAQMLLVCAWRTMKEVCLLMSDMCSLFQMEGENSSESANYILTVNQVSEIGDHLLFLLKNLMHRGVFEQVFVGFKQVSNRLWRSPSPILSGLPEKWLQSAIDQEHISTKSITRRSAGLPFIFQALLSAESDNEQFLQKWVQRLLIYDESPDMSPIRIHSMNVLRGLYRDANFSSAMMPFVPHGLKMAFRGLKSSDWTERNSGLMLYGAVMRRSFGAKLNLMNVPTFFRKFPQMYDFLLNELDTCILTMEKRKTERKLLNNVENSDPQTLTCDFTFHLLLLLSSFTSSGRVEDTHFKLADFIPRVRKCGESDDIEVRKLAAKALIPFLVSPEDKISLIMDVVNEIRTRIENISQNHLHGLLFQFLTIARHLPVPGCKGANSKLTHLFLSFTSLTSSPKAFKSPTIFEACLNIFSVLHPLKCVDKGVMHKRAEAMVNVFYERFPKHIPHRNTVPGLPSADKAVANAMITICADELETPQLLEMMYENFRESSPVSRSYVDQYLELMQDEGNQSTLSEKLVYTGDEITENLVVFFEAVIENYLRRVPTEFAKFPGTETELNYIKFLNKVPCSVLQAGESDLMQKLIQGLFKTCEGDEGGKETTTLQIKSAAFMFLGKVAFSTGIPLSDEQKTRLCDILVQWSPSGTDDDMRQACAEVFPSIPFPNMENFSELNQAKMWSSVFMLAQDDETFIRQIINMKLASNSMDHKPSCDRKSLEILAMTYVNQFLVKHPSVGILVIIGLLLREDFEVEAKAADDETEDRLFDKSEMNMYFEHVTFLEIIKTEIISLTESIEEAYSENLKISLDSSLSQLEINFYQTLSNANVALQSSDYSIRKIIESELNKNYDCYPLLRLDGKVCWKTTIKTLIRNSSSNAVKNLLKTFLSEALDILDQRIFEEAVVVDFCTDD